MLQKPLIIRFMNCNFVLNYLHPFIKATTKYEESDTIELMDAVNLAPFQMVRLLLRATLICSLETKEKQNTWIRALYWSHRLNTVLFLSIWFHFCFRFFRSLFWQMKPHLFINKKPFNLINLIWYGVAAGTAKHHDQIEFHCWMDAGKERNECAEFVGFDGSCWDAICAIIKWWLNRSPKWWYHVISLFGRFSQAKC